MYHKHHTRGIVVGSKIESNDSRRVSLFTEKFGLISAKVQGARNIHSKLRAGSQDFSFGEFSLIHGKTGWRVVSVRPEKNIYEKFRNSDLKLKTAINILNLIKRLVSEEEIYTPLFEIVDNFLEFLERSKESEMALAECLTLVRILHSLGYMRHDPELSIPLSHTEIDIKDLELIAPKRSQMISLINESLKAS